MPIQPAATVIIVRDASPQYEIFMLKRTNRAVFASGMYVFPGGRVDDADHEAYYEQHHQGPSSQQQAQQAALGDDWRAIWIAGIRETFEESGILLAYDASGELLQFDADNRHRFQDYRHQLHEGEISLATICQRESLTLALDLIHFYNRWVTPPGRPRRFDTRFFITQAPAIQHGLHDGKETVDSVWISPAEALRQCKEGEFSMMLVTEKQLADLNQYQTAAELIRMAENNTHFPHHRPGQSAPAATD